MDSLKKDSLKQLENAVGQKVIVYERDYIRKSIKVGNNMYDADGKSGSEPYDESFLQSLKGKING